MNARNEDCPTRLLRISQLSAVTNRFIKRTLETPRDIRRKTYTQCQQIKEEIGFHIDKSCFAAIGSRHCFQLDYLDSIAQAKPTEEAELQTKLHHVDNIQSHR